MKLWEGKQEEQHQTQEELVWKKEEKLRSKFLYKILLTLVKYTPIIILMVQITYSTFAYFCIDNIWLSYIGSVSLVNLLYLYIASYVFRFCYLYRLSLHSVVIVNLIALYDTLFRIPLSDLNMLRVYLIILLLGVIAFIKFKIKDNKRSV